MRVIIQRVSHASVTINKEIKSEINQGLLVFVGIEDADTPADIQWLSHKITNLRIFDDEQKIPNCGRGDWRAYFSRYCTG